jgi:hypothetical protein
MRLRPHARAGTHPLHVRALSPDNPQMRTCRQSRGSPCTPTPPPPSTPHACRTGEGAGGPTVAEENGAARAAAHAARHLPPPRLHGRKVQDGREALHVAKRDLRGADGRGRRRGRVWRGGGGGPRRRGVGALTSGTKTAHTTCTHSHGTGAVASSSTGGCRSVAMPRRGDGMASAAGAGGGGGAGAGSGGCGATVEDAASASPAAADAAGAPMASSLLALVVAAPQTPPALSPPPPARDGETSVPPSLAFRRGGDATPAELPARFMRLPATISGGGSTTGGTTGSAGPTWGTSGKALRRWRRAPSSAQYVRMAASVVPSRWPRSVALYAPPSTQHRAHRRWAV